jgi:N utilization substance protein A
MAELHGEKIDIVDYSDDAAEFVGHALSPARVSQVRIIDESNRVAQVIVPDYQLSLAIGKEGQNVRLAARLTGWRIDIQPDHQADGDSAAEPAAHRGHAPSEVGASRGAAWAHDRGGDRRGKAMSDGAVPASKVPGAADAPAL